MNFEWDIHTIFILFTALDLIQIVIFVVFGIRTTKDMIELREEADENSEDISYLYDRIEELNRLVETVRDRPQEVVVKIQKEDKS